MAKKNIHPELYIRTMIQPDGKKIEIVTTLAGAKDYVLPMNHGDHPAWSGEQFGRLSDNDRKSSRTKNTGADVFGF